MRGSVMELQAVSDRHPDGLEISVQSERPLLYLQVAIISKTWFYWCVPMLIMVLVTETHTDVQEKTWAFTFWKNHYHFKVLI